MSDSTSPRPITGLIWLLVAAVLLVGGYKLFHLHEHSADQQILIDHSKH